MTPARKVSRWPPISASRFPGRILIPPVEVRHRDREGPESSPVFSPLWVAYIGRLGRRPNSSSPGGCSTGRLLHFCPETSSRSLRVEVVRACHSSRPPRGPLFPTHLRPAFLRPADPAPGYQIFAIPEYLRRAVRYQETAALPIDRARKKRRGESRSVSGPGPESGGIYRATRGCQKLLSRHALLVERGYTVGG